MRCSMSWCAADPETLSNYFSGDECIANLRNYLVTTPQTPRRAVTHGIRVRHNALYVDIFSVKFVICVDNHRPMMIQGVYLSILLHCNRGHCKWNKSMVSCQKGPTRHFGKIPSNSECIYQTRRTNTVDHCLRTRKTKTYLEPTFFATI